MSLIFLDNFLLKMQKKIMCKFEQQFKHLELLQTQVNFNHFFHNPKQMITLEHMNYDV